MSNTSTVVFVITLSLLVAACVLPSHSATTRLSALSDVSPPSSGAATGCSFGGYNFTAMNRSDWFGVDNFKLFGYYLRVCGPVSQSKCNSSYTRSSMLCQVQLNDSQQTFNLATYDAAAVQWSWWNGHNVSDGIKFVTHNGDYCGTTPRTVVGRLVCDPSSTGTLSVAIDNAWHACVYNVTVPNPYTCAQQQRIDAQ